VKKSYNILLIILALVIFSFDNLLAAPPSTPTAIVGPIILCNGSSASFTVIQSGGADGFYWDVEGVAWSAESTTTSSTFNIITAGPSSATISVWAFNNDGNSGTFTITREHLGDPLAINAPAGFHCSSVSKTYTVDPVNMADYYVWSISGNGWTVSSSSSTWVEVTGGTGNAVLSVFAANFCDSSQTVSLQIIPSPPPDTILQVISGPHCAGSSNTYTVNPVAGATSYSWYLESSDGGWSATSSTTTDFVVSSTTATRGGATIYVAANNTCGSSATISKELNPYGAPQGLIVNPPGGHCVGSTRTYTVIPVDNAISYSWWFTGGTGWSASSSTTSDIIISSSATMTIGSATLSVAANTACGSTATYTQVIPVLYTPLAPESIHTAQYHCVGTSRTYSVDPVEGATAYAWNISNSSWSGSSTSNIINIIAGSGSTSITVTAYNNCGVSPPVTTVVSAWEVPATPILTEPDHNCTGESATYTADGGPYATSYTWYVSGEGWSGTNSSTNEFEVVAGTGSGTISVVANGPCGSSSTYTTVNLAHFVPDMPEKIYIPGNHCVGTVRPYACTEVEGASSYTWIITGTGWSGTSTTNYIDLTAGTGTAEISVRANSVCGSSELKTIYVIPNNVPTAPRGIDKPLSHCVGTVRTYSAAHVNNAVEYHWSIINDTNATSPWVIEETYGRNVDLTAGSSSATLTVFASNQCGLGSSFTEIIKPNTSPAQPGEISGPTNHCENSAEDYTIEKVAGADTYEWSVNGSGWSIDPSNTTHCVITAGHTQGTISVKAINNCGESIVRTKVVNPDTLLAAPTGVNKPNVHCQGTVKTYTVVAVPGASSYIWNITGSGWSGTSNAGTINITAGTGNANISVIAVNSCGNSQPYTFTAVSVPLPTSEFTVNKDTVYRDETVTVTYTGNAGPTATYDWDFDNGTASPGTGQGPHTVIWKRYPGPRTIKLIVTENGCQSKEKLVSIFVKDSTMPGVLDNISEFVKIDLLPNPSNGNLTVRINNSLYNNVTLDIINPLGISVYHNHFDNLGTMFNKTLDLNSLASGSYYVKFKFKNGEIVKKLVIIK